MIELKVLDLFKVMVVDKPDCNLNMDYIEEGLVLDFEPTPSQLAVLRQRFKPLPIKTLFSVEERENSSPEELLLKQCLHYFEVYGLGFPGLFELEVTSGKVVSLTFIKGVDRQYLPHVVQNLIYSNAPLKEATDIRDIIVEYQIPYDINQIKNNEIKVILFDQNKDVFTDGDDAVRFICYKTTGNSLLIKSKEVISKVSHNEKVIPTDFFKRHELPLAEVFNRHKKLILACKTRANASVINRITRLSKIKHKPIKPSIHKTFLTLAFHKQIPVENWFAIIKETSLRDRFKYLNLIAYKKQQNDTDAFVIRNGKVHIEPGRKIIDRGLLDQIENEILCSLEEDLLFLKQKNILLDPKVDYGLPISRKQTLGNLPFGTRVDIQSNVISSGIYWEDEWGAWDLDLSAVDKNGNRVGWGQWSGYEKGELTFSGDVTSAPEGAMEFMTSDKEYDKLYGLFVNIYSGELGSKAEVVIGSKSKNLWIEDVQIREKIDLKTRGNIIGFVKNGIFTAYQCSMNDNYMSGPKEKAILTRGTSDFWTIQSLLKVLGIQYSLDKSTEVVYDYDLSYEGFTYDKLETLFELQR